MPTTVKELLIELELKASAAFKAMLDDNTKETRKAYVEAKRELDWQLEVVLNPKDKELS